MASQAPVRTRISSKQQALQILEQLAGQQKRLATDLPYFEQQAYALLSAVAYLDSNYSNQPQSTRQLLQQQPQLVRQLMQLSAAALQQLAANLDSIAQVCAVVGGMCEDLCWLLHAVQGRKSGMTAPSTPADVANLRLAHDTGGGDYVNKLVSQPLSGLDCSSLA
jgi:hypothetical protein